MTGEERPLKAQVAEAIGWTEIQQDGEPKEWFGRPPEGGLLRRIPDFPLSWCVTGPLIERYRLSPQPFGGDSGSLWTAWANETAFGGECAYGQTPLIAICNLILLLSEKGKLKEIL